MIDDAPDGPGPVRLLHANGAFAAALDVRSGKARIRAMDEAGETEARWRYFLDVHVADVLRLGDELKDAGVPTPEDPNDYANDPTWILAFPEHPLDVREVF